MEYELDCTMTKANAVRLIKALSDALLEEGDVKLGTWCSFTGSPLVFIEVNGQAAGRMTRMTEIQS